MAPAGFEPKTGRRTCGWPQSMWLPPQTDRNGSGSHGFQAKELSTVEFSCITWDISPNLLTLSQAKTVHCPMLLQLFFPSCATETSRVGPGVQTLTGKKDHMGFQHAPTNARMTQEFYVASGLTLQRCQRFSWMGQKYT